MPVKLKKGVMYESRGEQGIMGKDYKDIQMDRQLRKDGSLASRRRESVTGYDFGVNYQVPTGGLSYSQLNIDSRAYTAIVTLKKRQGSFDNIKDAVEFVNRQGGGRILIMPGTYTIDYDIPLYDDISIEGLSEKDVILDFNSSGSYSIKLDGVDDGDRINNVEIKKMTIKNNHNTTTGTIYLDWVDNLLIENITFTDNRTGSSGYDIFCTSTSNVDRFSIIRCKASGGAIFLSIRSGYDNVIRDCEFTGYNDIVIKGIETGTGLRHFVIDNNRFDSNPAGVFYGYMYYTAFTNNKLTGDVTSNSMIEITKGQENNFAGNYIDSDNNAATLFKTVTNNDFYTNNYFRNAGSGATIEINGSGHYFSSNRVYNAGTGNALLLGSSSAINSITFSSGKIHADGDTAVKISHTDSDNCIFTGSLIQGAGTGYAVDIDSGVDRAMIVGNSLSGGTVIRDNSGVAFYETATDGDPFNT